MLWWWEMKPNNLFSIQRKISTVPEKFSFKDSHSIEHKEDGRRLTIFKGVRDFVAIYRKPVDVWEEVSQNLSVLKALQNIPANSVIDGEILPEKEKDFASQTLTDIQRGTARFKIFSLPVVAGIESELSGFSLRKQLEVWGNFAETPEIFSLGTFAATIPHLMKTFHSFEGKPLESMKRVLTNYIREREIEGLIIRDQKTKEAYKYKSAKTITAVVIKKKIGNIDGKYFLTLGSFILGLYDKRGRMVEIGSCSGFSDLDRDKFWEMEIDSIPPVEVEYDTLTVKNKLRFAQFKCLREDRTKESCTLDKLIK